MELHILLNLETQTAYNKSSSKKYFCFDCSLEKFSQGLMFAKQPPPVSDQQISEFWVVPHSRFDYMWQLEILVTALHAPI